MLDYYNKRQLEIVEFAERVYHEGLRHTGLNGTLYEDFLINYLRKDIPELKFFKGQIFSPDKLINKTSAQYDIIICKRGIEQKDFLKPVSSVINIVSPNDVYGVVELKKWAFPKMVSKEGTINYSYRAFKQAFPNLDYIFLCLRFRDRKLVNDGIKMIN